MERHFHERLDKLNKKVLEMASMAEEAIFKATESLKNNDTALADWVIENDKKIDEMENTIEAMVIDLLALQQPMAKDLRFITTGMKVNAELERIADLATNIAKCVLFVAHQPKLKPPEDIPRLFILAKDMVKKAVNAFVERNRELAKEVIQSDEEADMLRTKIQEELVKNYMSEDKTLIPRAISMFLAARHYERICDHATNIAEDVIFMIDARVVKHHPEILESGENDGK
ncbi:MAG: phosphate signaling complex protein PhoU [Candidatus Omnitrophica bacterium]|nr:phosphate signaling complex protein PhoU [Candidatus Omnitrophota bacterium]